jgi:Spy/CpxP family protein refolding chaperone
MSMNMLRTAEVLSPKQRGLRELLVLTDDIRQMAENNDWAEAVAEQQRRRALMDNFFSQEFAPVESQQVAQVIEEILKIDQQVADLLYSQRSAMLSDASQSRQNVHNIDKYLNNSSV